jgi:hypothetical protein
MKQKNAPDAVAAIGESPAENSFFCKGKMFIFFNFGHPDKNNLAPEESRPIVVRQVTMN